MVKLNNGILFIILSIFCLQNQLSAQIVSLSDGTQNNNDFSARIENDILILENKKICPYLQVE